MRSTWKASVEIHARPLMPTRKMDLPGLLIALMCPPLALEIEISGIVGMKYKDHRDGAQRCHMFRENFVGSSAIPVFLDVEDTRLHFLDGHQIIEFDSFGAYGQAEFVEGLMRQGFRRREPVDIAYEFQHPLPCLSHDLRQRARHSNVPGRNRIIHICWKPAWGQGQWICQGGREIGRTQDRRNSESRVAGIRG